MRVSDALTAHEHRPASHSTQEAGGDGDGDKGLVQKGGNQRPIV